MVPSSKILLYGAAGVTGRMILSRLALPGLKPRLAGRDTERLAALGARYALPIYEAKIDDPAALANCLPQGGLLINAAGPFAITAMPLVDAALSRGCDYLDVSGELDSLRALDAERVNIRSRDTIVRRMPIFGRISPLVRPISH